ncbi:ImcF-related family protein [Cupriavidus pauculus]|uniref:ImcF-related family protein n=1 Tax=Cupriavidus pauculus TaxID=82633 RepID=UPI0038576CD8
MNEYKSQPTARYFSIGIIVIFAALMLAVWVNRQEFGWTDYLPLAIELGLLSTCLLLLIFVRFFEAILLNIASLRAVRWLRSYDQNDTTQGSGKPSARSWELARSQGREIRDALRAMHGWRWRYRQPWLLLIGSDAAIDQLLPESAQSGWRLTPAAVLLWSKPGDDGQPDIAWLRQIYKLRRRPVDAVVLATHATVDANTDSGFHDGIWLTQITDALRWAAPTYVLDIEQDSQPSDDIPVIACEVPRHGDAPAIEAALHSLRDRLSGRSLAQLPQKEEARYLGRLSQRLDGGARSLAEYLARLSTAARRQSIRGIAFSPVPATGQPDAGVKLPIWQYLGETARSQPGRHTAWHPLTIGVWLALLAIGLWTAGMLISGLRNEHDLQTAQQAVHNIESAPTAAARLKALDTLQQQILRYEYRVQHHAPLFTRFGLNRDTEVLAALWKPYAKASQDIVVTPVVQDLESSLVDLSQLRTDGLSEETAKWALDGRDTLKAYLMLAHPERVEPAFLSRELAAHWSTDARITPGQRQDLAERFAKFYAEHLKVNPAWRIEPRSDLVAGARQTLLAVIGERNAVDAVYQNVLDGAGAKYPDQTLASLTSGTDPRGLMRASAAVPGVFTRQAYEGYVEAAIEKAAKRQDVANDWVIADGKPQPARQMSSASAADFRKALTERYFADYAEHWQQFMNGMQWEPAATLPGVVDQLKLMADARQSPVIALMKSLAYQGGAGARKDSLSDTLVAKAQGILGKKDEAPEAARPDPAGPLAAAFGPVLRLVGQPGQGGGSSGSTGSSDLSLQRYLDRITAVRLRLQQLTNSADADMQARQMAQSLFQGKGSDLADTQAYGQLMAASLGAEWAGMGDTLFVHPIAQALQSVLQPAQASLNEAWRQSIAMPWNRAFATRYPFADTANDASLPELARHIRPQSGLINAFLLAELAGVLVLQGDQWVPVGSGAHGLAFDPAFLQFINTLQRVGAHLLVQGDPQYRFELKPIPTPGLTDTMLTVDNQTLHYYNQRETWQSMTWPANNLQAPRTLLQWQTETASTNKRFETEGVWAWIRMLEHARVTPVDSATVQLTFQAAPDTLVSGQGEVVGNESADAVDRPDNPESLLPRAARLAAPADMRYPIRYQMRAAVGRGPLEALELRNLRMPERIFVGRESPALAGTAAAMRR